MAFAEFDWVAYADFASRARHSRKLVAQMELRLLHLEIYLPELEEATSLPQHDDITYSEKLDRLFDAVASCLAVHSGPAIAIELHLPSDSDDDPRNEKQKAWIRFLARLSGAFHAHEVELLRVYGRPTLPECALHAAAEHVSTIIRSSKERPSLFIGHASLFAAVSPDGLAHLDCNEGAPDPDHLHRLSMALTPSASTLRGLALQYALSGPLQVTQPGPVRLPELRSLAIESIGRSGVRIGPILTVLDAPLLSRLHVEDGDPDLAWARGEFDLFDRFPKLRRIIVTCFGPIPDIAHLVSSCQEHACRLELERDDVLPLGEPVDAFGRMAPFVTSLNLEHATPAAFEGSALSTYPRMDFLLLERIDFRYTPRRLDGQQADERSAGITAYGEFMLDFLRRHRLSELRLLVIDCLVSLQGCTSIDDLARVMEVADLPSLTTLKLTLRDSKLDDASSAERQDGPHVQ